MKKNKHVSILCSLIIEPVMHTILKRIHSGFYCILLCGIYLIFHRIWWIVWWNSLVAKENFWIISIITSQWLDQVESYNIGNPYKEKKPVLVLRSRLKKNLFLLWTKEKKVNSLWSLIVKTPDIRLPPLSWYWWWLFRDIYIHNIHTGGYLIMIISLTINKKVPFLKYILINFYEYLNL